MGYDPFERVPLGRTALSLSRLGYGAASIGGLYRPVADADAHATVRRAWQLGIRYFDVAPLYGYGNAERRIGLGLRDRPRDEFVLSTKVGRLAVPHTAIAPDADIDQQLFEGREDAYYQATPPVRMVFDYSYDGIMRSVEESLKRTGLERLDILYIHDPDEHWEAAIGGAYPALADLRRQGVVKAIGAGMNQPGMLARFAREGDFDVFLVAGRYTLLDQSALPELLPLCTQRNVAVVIGGVMNSGILADPTAGARFDYKPADAHWTERALRLRDVCARFDVPLKAVAVQFVLAHPAVVSVVAGVRAASRLDEYPELMRHPIPDELWPALREAGLLPTEAPTPDGHTG